MNAVTDEEVEAAANLLARMLGWGGGRDGAKKAARTIITAALSIRQGGVKALEWKAFQGGYWVRAEAIGKVYEIRGDDPDLETKKAAAQADFNTRILSALSPAPEIADKPSAVSVGDRNLRVAARNLIACRFDTYRARNGHQVSIEGDDGEKCWIVNFDEMHELETALKAAQEGK